MNNILHTVSAL